MRGSAIAFLFLAAAACAPEPSAAGLPADFAALVPADAVAIMQLRSARELDDQAETLSQYDPADEERQSFLDLPEDLLQDLLGVDGFDDAPLTPDQPVGLVLSLGASVLEPVLTIILPTAEPQALAAALTDPMRVMSTSVSGSYVALRIGNGKAAAHGASPLLENFPPGLVSLRADLDAIIAAYRPLIDVGLAQLEPLIEESAQEDPNPLVDPGRIIEWYAQGIRDLVESAERLDLAVDRRGRDLTLALQLRNREGSPMARIGRAERVDYEALAGRLDPQAAIQIVSSYSMSAQIDMFWEEYETMLEKMEQQSELPPEVVAAFGAYIRGMREILPLLGREMAASYDIGPDGIRMSVDVQAHDPADVTSRMIALLRGQDLAALGFEAGPEHRGELAGQASISWKQKVDFGQLFRLMQPGTVPALMDEKKLEELNALFVGKEGMEIALLPGRDRLGMLAGGDIAWRESAARRLTTGGTADPEILRALEALASANPGLYAQVDMRAIFEIVFGALMAGDAEDPAAKSLAQALASLGDQNFRFSMYGGVAGRTLLAGASLDLEDLASWLASFDSNR